MSRHTRDIILTFVGILLLLSQVVIQALNLDVSAVLTGAGLAALGIPLAERFRPNGNGGIR